MESEKLTAVVTVGRKSKSEAVRLARETAERLRLPYVSRHLESCRALREKYGVEFIMVVKNGTLTLDTPGGEFFFHPGMAHMRLKNLSLGGQDHMILAMGLTEGMSVLDCTLGFASDALVAASVVGQRGRVVGLEANPLVAAVIEYGLAHHTGENYAVHRAMRLIEVKNREHGEFLRELPDDSFDVVYFDPMFRHPFTDSVSLNPLRSLAMSSAIDAASVAEAVRVAKRRVVLKESALSREFARLGFPLVVGGRYSRIKYGVIHKNGR